MRPDRAWFHAALRRHAEEMPERNALKSHESSYTYAQLLAEVGKREAILSTLPAGPVALIMDNSPEALLWDLATLFSKRAGVLLPPFFSRHQRIHCLRQTQASLVMADEALADELLSEGFVRGEHFWHRPSTGTTTIPQGTAKITYTSGSTGTPKGVCLSAEAMLNVANELEWASRPTEPTRYLSVLPLGVLLENLGIYAALLAGASVTMLPQEQLGLSGASGIDMKRLLGAIVLSQAQSLILVPQLLLGLVIAAERGLIPTQQLRFIAVGGARVSQGLLERAQALGLPVFEGYGLSECSSVVCLNTPQYNHPGTVGRPLPHAEVRLGEDNEILVRGATMLGYLGDPPFLGEWWPTGDIGHFDAEGYLHIRGRKKNQFITSFGRNVNPEWVEAELTQDGTILQAFIHGEGLSRNLALLWPLSPGASDSELEAAVQRCNQTLPDYARVHRWARLPEPFSTNNGLLTGNGRPRREAIFSHYHSILSRLAHE